MEHAEKIKELKAKALEISAEIKAELRDHRREAIKGIKKTIAEYALCAPELFAGERKKRKAIAQRPAKYKDPASGKTWTGQGRAPKWFVHDRASGFLIA